MDAEIKVPWEETPDLSKALSQFKIWSRSVYGKPALYVQGRASLEILDTNLRVLLPEHASDVYEVIRREKC